MATTPASSSAKGDVAVTELTRGRQSAVRRVAEARATVPDVTLTAEAGVEALLAAGTPLRGAVAAAAARALDEHPAVNGAYRDGRLEAYSRVHVAVALEGPDGAVAPVLFDAAEADAATLEARLGELEGRAAAGELTAPDLSNATFGVTVLDVPGLRSVVPVVPGGHAAALGCGAPERRPVVAEDGTVAARRSVVLTLAVDARALGAPEAARFLARVRELLETAAL